jgi:hypothetical protein
MITPISLQIKELDFVYKNNLQRNFEIEQHKLKLLLRDYCRRNGINEVGK